MQNSQIGLRLLIGARGSAHSKEFAAFKNHIGVQGVRGPFARLQRVCFARVETKLQSRLFMMTPVSPAMTRDPKEAKIPDQGNRVASSICGAEIGGIPSQRCGSRLRSPNGVGK